MKHNAIWGAVLALTVLALTARSEAAETDLTLLYAQQCVAEVSLAFRKEVPEHKQLRQKIEECNLMWHILRNRSEHSKYTEEGMIYQYTSLFKRKKSWRFYIFDLNPAITKPDRWPDNMRWEDHKTTWSEIYTLAGKFVAGETSHPCPAANQFGGRCDNNEHACDATPRCWTRQWCKRPKSWWSQAYHTERPCPSGAIPAALAAGSH